MRPFDAQMRGREVPTNEIVRLRTLVSKTFNLGRGQRRLIKCFCPIHYPLPNGDLDDIDLTPRDDGDAWLIDRAPYILRISKTEPSITYEGRITGQKAEFSHVDVAGAVDFDADMRGWWAAGLGKDIAAHVRPGAVSVETWLNAETADPNLLWSVRSDLALAPERGMDAAENPIEIVANRFTGRVSKLVDLETRRREWKTEPPIWPARIA